MRKLGVTLPRLAVLRTLTRTARPAGELATACGQQHGHVLRIVDWLTGHGFAEEGVGWALTAIGRAGIETGVRERLTRSQRSVLEDLGRVEDERALTDLAPAAPTPQGLPALPLTPPGMRTVSPTTLFEQVFRGAQCPSEQAHWGIELRTLVYLGPPDEILSDVESGSPVGPASVRAQHLLAQARHGAPTFAETR
ncbi:hypothetical protein K8O92_26415 [Nocardia asteroides]|nr:hypothetical protein K8O92_26415 [Nocardia asteroides]